MENPGLITYTETLLLSKDNDLNFKKRYAEVGAHELAHQWFGNLVTNAWWNDLWLNESFATWASAKVVGDFNPEWRSDVSWMGRKNEAMEADRLSSARIIHQPIVSEGDIGAAFDRITYAKGASVLAMFEGWLGAETFQRGIQHYLGNNQWKSLVASDFLEAMDTGTGLNVSDAFTTFIDHPGTPLVSFDLRCEKGSTPSLAIRHERYKPLGSKVSESPGYKVPVCVRFPTSAKASERICIVADENTSEIPLEGATSCPAWIVPNDGATGYYRSQLSPQLLAGLQKKAPLSAGESLALASDLDALVRSGGAPLSSLLGQVATMAASRDAGLVQTAAELAALGTLVGETDRKGYQRWLRKHFGKTAKTLGWSAKAGEALEKTPLREEVLALLIFEANDRELGAKGQALAKAWLADPKSVDANVAGLALRVGARLGDTALLDQYVSAIKATSDRSRRRLLLDGLGAVSSPELMSHALKVMLDKDIDVRESHRMLRALAADTHSGHLALEFLDANFSEIHARYGEEMGRRLGGVASVQCDPARTNVVRSFLKDHIATMEGGERTADQSLERHELCLAERAAITLPARFGL